MDKVRIAKQLVRLAKELSAAVAPYSENQIKLLEKHGFTKVDEQTYELTLDEFTLKTLDNSKARQTNIIVPIDITINGNRIISGSNFISEAKEIMTILSDFGYKNK